MNILNIEELDLVAARPASQQPHYADLDQVESVSNQLAARPPLVFVREVDDLQKNLAMASVGDAFVFQGGSCAETFVVSLMDKLIS